jgi:hypothetical protein
MNRNTDAQNLHVTANDGKPMLQEGTVYFKQT